jgi:hypothetical protein
MSRPPFAPALALVASLTLAPTARADWPPSGVGICTDPADQIGPSITSDGVGGAFIAWVDNRSSRGIYAQRVSSAGDIPAGWPTDGILLSPPISGIAVPTAAPDDSGGAFFAWGNNAEIHLQRITSSAEIAAGWPSGGMALADTRPYVEFGIVVPDGNGGAIVAWGNYANANIRVQRVAANGTIAPGWTLGGVVVSEAGGTFGTPTPVSDGAGGAIIAWENVSGVDGAIYAQRIASTGSRATGWPADGMVVCGSGGRKRVVHAAADGNGGAFIAWSDERDMGLTGTDIYLQRVTGEGAVAPGWPTNGLAVCTATGDQIVPRLAADGTGGAIAVWRDRRAAPEGDLYAQRITGASAVASGWPANGVAVCSASGAQSPSFEGMTRDGAGGVLFCWTDSRDSLLTGRDIYVQRLLADGTTAPGWPTNGLALCSAPGDQNFPRIVRNGAGGAIVCWEDGRTGTGNGDIYAARINADATTPVLVSLVSAEAREGLVRLDWYAAGATLRATVYRRTPETEWTARAGVSADGAGHVLFEDTEVVSGGRYAYRLGILEHGGESFAGEVWVVVPATASLSLAAAWNPGERLTVSFSLPGVGPASLELFDPVGRRLASQSLDGMGPGSHALVLDQEPVARAGLYLVRLRQGPFEATAKAVLLR